MDVFVVRTLAKSFLQCVVGQEPSGELIAVFTSVARRVSYEHVSEGDVIVPLRSVTLREATPPNTPLAHLLNQPSQHILQMIRELVSACEVPIARLELSGVGEEQEDYQNRDNQKNDYSRAKEADKSQDMDKHKDKESDKGRKDRNKEFLHIYLARAQMMQRTFSRLAQVGLAYGATDIMDQMNVSITSYGLGREVNSDTQKGNHLWVKTNEKANTGKEEGTKLEVQHQNKCETQENCKLDTPKSALECNLDTIDVDKCGTHNEKRLASEDEVNFGQKVNVNSLQKRIENKGMVDNSEFKVNCVTGNYDENKLQSHNKSKLEMENSINSQEKSESKGATADSLMLAEMNLQPQAEDNVATLRSLVLASHLLRLVRFHRGRLCLRPEVEERVEERRRQMEERKRQEEEKRRLDIERERKKIEITEEDKRRVYKAQHRDWKENRKTKEERVRIEKQRRIGKRISRAFNEWNEQDWEDVKVEVVDGMETNETVEWEGEGADELMRERKRKMKKKRYTSPRHKPYQPPLSDWCPILKSEVEFLSSRRSGLLDDKFGSRTSSIPLYTESMRLNSSKFAYSFQSKLDIKSSSTGARAGQTDEYLDLNLQTLSDSESHQSLNLQTLSDSESHQSSDYKTQLKSSSPSKLNDKSSTHNYSDMPSNSSLKGSKDSAPTTEDFPWPNSTSVISEQSKNLHTALGIDQPNPSPVQQSNPQAYVLGSEKLDPAAQSILAEQHLSDYLKPVKIQRGRGRPRKEHDQVNVKTKEARVKRGKGGKAINMKEEEGQMDVKHTESRMKGVNTQVPLQKPRIVKETLLWDLGNRRKVLGKKGMSKINRGKKIGKSIGKFKQPLKRLKRLKDGREAQKIGRGFITPDWLIESSKDVMIEKRINLKHTKKKRTKTGKRTLAQKARQANSIIDELLGRHRKIKSSETTIGTAKKQDSLLFILKMNIASLHEINYSLTQLKTQQLRRDDGYSDNYIDSSASCRKNQVFSEDINLQSNIDSNISDSRYGVSLQDKQLTDCKMVSRGASYCSGVIGWNVSDGKTHNSRNVDSKLTGTSIQPTGRGLIEDEAEWVTVASSYSIGDNCDIGFENWEIGSEKSSRGGNWAMKMAIQREGQEENKGSEVENASPTEDIKDEQFVFLTVFPERGTKREKRLNSKAAAIEGLRIEEEGKSGKVLKTDIDCKKEELTIENRNKSEKGIEDKNEKQLQVKNKNEELEVEGGIRKGLKIVDEMKDWLKIEYRNEKELQIRDGIKQGLKIKTISSNKALNKGLSSVHGSAIDEWKCQCAGVVDKRTGKPWNASASDFHRLVFAELQRAAEGKQYEAKDEEAWNRFLDQQTESCVKLNLLSVSHHCPLKIQTDGQTHNSKEWAFVLYNYSRLCVIFETFDDLVYSGDMPPLPPPHLLDFSLLRHDEEWSLVWAFVIRWPEVVKTAGQELLEWGRGTNQERHRGKEQKKGEELRTIGKVVQYKTGLVTRFLSQLAHSASRYYARHHVLPSDPFLPHLHPLAHCRLHLLHALHTVMKAALALLGIDNPPTSM